MYFLDQNQIIWIHSSLMGNLNRQPKFWIQSLCWLYHLFKALRAQIFDWLQHWRISIILTDGAGGATRSGLKFQPRHRRRNANDAAFTRRNLVNLAFMVWIKIEWRRGEKSFLLGKSQKVASHSQSVAWQQRGAPWHFCWLREKNEEIYCFIQGWSRLITLCLRSRHFYFDRSASKPLADKIS